MKIKVGSEAHKELFCRQFLETHEHYDPATLPWPELDDAQLGRLRSVPFWQEVYHTERRAGAIVAAFTPLGGGPVGAGSHRAARRGRGSARGADPA